jgi:hypothetical protein
MKTIEVEVFKFEELTPDLQDKLIDNNRDALVQDEYWFEPILEGFLEDMGELGHEISGKDIEFSGFWSQGDGACFHTKNGKLSSRALLKESGIKLKSLPRGFGKEMDEGLVVFELLKNTLRYSHQNTVYLQYCYDGDNDKIEEAIADIIPTIESMLRNKMRTLYADLEKAHDSLTTDEVVKEELIERDYQYLVDGSVFN